MAEREKARTIQELYDLSDKVALVTGGYGLYGQWISQALAEAGAQVIVASRNLEKCEAYAEELEAAGGNATGMQLDQGDEASILALRDRIDESFGGLDVLVNNAVGRFPVKNMLECDTDHWPDYMQVNATGVMLVGKHFGTYMHEQGHGSIINISSIYGVVGPTFHIYEGSDVTSPAEYAFVKGGFSNLTRHMATLLAPKVRVNALAPGGLFNDQHPTFVENYEAHCPLGRMAGPDDIKGPTVFLASDAAQYVTGQVIGVDGGWTAW
jgi:NAD(P)-dependent dehydrogenase (short-subunit alcohol dehydrogenase family)